MAHDKLIHDSRSANAPIKTAVMEILLRTNPDHPMAVKFREQEKKYHDTLQSTKPAPAVPKPELPPLRHIGSLELYESFKFAFEKIHAKPFDESANNGEARRLALTLCAYFLKKNSFLKSPLLSEESKPSVRKGIMIIGSYGTGKTATLKTFHELFQPINRFTVLDIEGTTQFVSRYKLGFAYHTANEIVKLYEAGATSEEKELFWNRFKKGPRYFDDLMTEGTASNFGKVEIFKDLLEMRYESGAKTLVSLNYTGQTVQSTLEEIISKYGPRVYDRIFEMFNILKLEGHTMRK